MANDLTMNPWVLDSASGTNIVEGDVLVLKVRWTEATTPGHAVEIQHGNGKPAWRSVAASGNNIEEDPEPFWCRGGIKLATLGSGKVYLYVKESPWQSH